MISFNFFLFQSTTEQRAQKSEEKVADLELQLKDVIEKLRALENVNREKANSSPSMFEPASAPTSSNPLQSPQDTNASHQNPPVEESNLQINLASQQPPEIEKKE